MVERRAEWFENAINMSTESLKWGMDTIPEERRNITPPAKLGEWTALRQVFHLLYYEREVALPSIRLWLGGAYPTFEGYDEGMAWDTRDAKQDPLKALAVVRNEIVAGLFGAEESAWEQARSTPWGEKTLYWVASKTYQHSIEHLSGVLRAAMLWDHYASRKGSQAASVVE